MGSSRERTLWEKTFDKKDDGKLEFDEIHQWSIPMRGESREEGEHLMEGTDENVNGYICPWMKLSFIMICLLELERLTMEKH